MLGLGSRLGRGRKGLRSYRSDSMISIHRPLLGGWTAMPSSKPGHKVEGIGVCRLGILPASIVCRVGQYKVTVPYMHGYLSHTFSNPADVKFDGGTVWCFGWSQVLVQMTSLMDPWNRDIDKQYHIPQPTILICSNGAPVVWQCRNRTLW